MRARAVVPDEHSVDQAVGAILAADARLDGRVVLRKGTRLDAAHRTTLLALAGIELHLVDLDPGELEQDEVARRLARALAGPGTCVQAVEQGQARLRAAHRGLLRVDAEAMRRINRLVPLLCFTLPDGQVVLEGDDVAGVKSATLATPAGLLEEAEAILRERAPALTVRAFAPWRVAAIVTDRIEPRGRGLVLDAVRRKVAWYGSDLAGVSEVAHDRAAVGRALRDALAGGADLLLVSGANALDPLDPVLVALREAGGEVLRTGVPAHPGSMVWAGGVSAVPVLGVATCAGFGKNTALDLVLARVLAGEEPVAAVEDVAHGGLAEGAQAAGRFPPYERG